MGESQGERKPHFDKKDKVHSGNMEWKELAPQGSKVGSAEERERIYLI